MDRTTAGAGAVVLGSDYRALGMVRGLGRRGVPVCVLRDDHYLANVSRYARRTFAWPRGSGEDRVRFLLALADAHRLRGWALIPTADDTAAFVARHADALASVYRLTTPSWDTLRWAFDKRLTYALARDLGIAAPLTMHPRDRADVARYAGPFPAILKPAYRLGSNAFTESKAWPADDHDALLARYDDAAALVDRELIMVQEIVPGGGEAQLSCAALCRDGEVRASILARRTRQWPMDFGRASTFVESVDAPDAEAAAVRLLRALRWDGLVEVEFKRDPRDGALKLLDVNPRVWGWHTLGGRAGVDFAHLLWRQAMLGEDLPRTRGRAGVRWVRMLTDLPTSLREVLRGRLSPLSYLMSLRPPIEYAIFAADDPLPALVELPAAVGSAWARRARTALPSQTRGAA